MKSIYVKKYVVELRKYFVFAVATLKSYLFCLFSWVSTSRIKFARLTVLKKWKIFWTKRFTTCGKCSAKGLMVHQLSGNSKDALGIGDIGKTRVRWKDDRMPLGLGTLAKQRWEEWVIGYPWEWGHWQNKGGWKNKILKPEFTPRWTDSVVYPMYTV